MFDSLIAFFMSILIFMLNLTSPPVPDAKPQDELTELANVCSEYEPGETIYVMSAGSFRSPDERAVAIALQGIVAKTNPQIYIPNCSLDNVYLNTLKEMGCKLSYTDENGKGWTLEALLDKFSYLLGDNSYILYRADEAGKGINIATNYATLNSWLPVPENCEEIALNAGLTKIKDISKDEYSVYYEWNFFEKYKHRFNKKAVCHQAVTASGLRDLAIQQGFFTFFTDDDIIEEVLFRNRVLSYFGDNTFIIGWAKYEVAFVDSISKNGNMILPSDHAHNNSILSSVKCEIPENASEKNIYTDETKHYAALVMSDGDNIQWIQNGYGEFFSKISLKTDFPVTWSFSPMLQDFSPATVKKVYESADKNDYFMAGVSGAGYIHPTQYPKNALTEFTDNTAAAMLKSDLQYVQILDRTPKNSLEEAKLINSLKYYARYDNIKGGIISLDPTRYAGGNGKIYFVNDKPFMTYRFSLWHPSGTREAVTEEWLNEQAAVVNDYPADINSIDGYSVINIHPWSISPESLEYFVNQLDENIVLVTVDELMEMINLNIPHQNA